MCDLKSHVKENDMISYGDDRHSVLTQLTLCTKSWIVTYYVDKKPLTCTLMS